ncbi:BTB/POZ domain-containing protein [Ditylenchus destructor]|uniref:BTB/POZ domain-containing protein n=1 Tax=Ditylenchus destructor TaxID=166010 RepID=A0AAD4QXD7_9BILA|nr:BTB/POZ domain-containing protein [Ditylenchus destructor]
MATTKDVDESPHVSEQHTKTTFLSTKLKWRIEHFNEAIRFYKVGQSISSNTFVLPHLGAVWILDVYPNGNKHGAGCTEIYLRLAGFQAPNGSISVDDTKIGAMLEFMYTGAVKTEVMDNIASELLALSDKYAVFSLKKMCETNLASRLTKTNVLKRAILADRSLAGKLKKACVNRLATDGRAVLKSQEWEHLKTEKKYLADELLELLVKDHPCFANMHEEASEETK